MNEQSPASEARSLVVIVALLSGVALYLGNLDWVGWIGEWISGQVPVLSNMPAGAVGALGIGGLICCLGMGLSPIVGRWISEGGLGRLDEQSRRLEQQREKIWKRKRERDKWEVR